MASRAVPSSVRNGHVKSLQPSETPHERSLSRYPNYSCQRRIDKGGTETPASFSTMDVNKTVLARSSVRKEIEIALQDVHDVSCSRVGLHLPGVNRTGVVRLHQRDLPDGRTPEQVLGHPGRRVDEPYPRGVPRVGERRHHLPNDQKSDQKKGDKINENQK